VLSCKGCYCAQHLRRTNGTVNRTSLSGAVAGPCSCIPAVSEPSHQFCTHRLYLHLAGWIQPGSGHLWSNSKHAAAAWCRMVNVAEPAPAACCVLDPATCMHQRCNRAAWHWQQRHPTIARCFCRIVHAAIDFIRFALFYIPRQLTLAAWYHPRFLRRQANECRSVCRVNEDGDRSH
jgi:hypothetical protein